jgi:colanic acid/amylovoran biosynthesis glycosyltransferase
MHALALDDRPVALIFRSPLFNASEGFVQAQAAGLQLYQPVVLGLEDKGHVTPALRGRTVLPAGRMAGWRMASGDFSPVLKPLSELRPRLVHAHFGPDGLRALPLARKLGLPLITSLRGYDVQLGDAVLIGSGRWSWMAYAMRKSRLMRDGALFLAVSDALRSRAVARGFPERRTVTHYNGVDLDRYRPDPQVRREPIVLHVGRLVEKKGTLDLIRAFARIAPAIPEAQLLILGDGPLRPRLEREARASGYGERIRFAGHRPADEVARQLGKAWLLAAPSVTARNGDAEGLPNVVVEAAAAGVPVVGTDHAGIPEAVADGVTGLLVPERSHEQLGEALLRVLCDPAMQAGFGLAARHLAEERFDARLQSVRLEALYDSVSGR